jgi:hypothetical protein
MEFPDKFAWIEHQIRQVMFGNLNSVACPYCGSETAIGEEKLCCAPMGDAAATVLHRIEPGLVFEMGGFAYPLEPQLVEAAGRKKRFRPIEISEGPRRGCDGLKGQPKDDGIE